VHLATGATAQLRADEMTHERHGAPIAATSTLVAMSHHPLGELRNELDEALALQRCCGALMLTQGLRYKKKMSLVAMAASGRRGHVGYCMMTFVLRNGLRALQIDTRLYMEYVQRLVQRWALQTSQQATCIQFAKSWVAWLRKHGGAGSINESNYLHAAEAFAAAYVAGQLPQANVSSFRGIVLAIGFDSTFLEEVREAVGIMCAVQPRPGMTWNRSLPESGCLIAMNPLIDNAVRLLAVVWLAGSQRHHSSLACDMDKLLLQAGILVAIVLQRHGYVTLICGLT
jgi:hypothetical protein